MFNAEHPVLMSSFASGRTLVLSSFQRIVVPLLLLGCLGFSRQMQRNYIKLSALQSIYFAINYSLIILSFRVILFQLMKAPFDAL